MLPSRIKESLICFVLLLEIFKSILLQGKYHFLAIEKFCIVHDLIILLSFGAQRNISLIFLKSVQRRRKASVVADTIIDVRGTKPLFRRFAYCLQLK